VSVAEAAEHFEVPPEQLREAVRLIAVSGIPGETASYQHGDLFDIAWDDFEDNDQIVLTNMVAIDDSPRFSAREAAALIAGLQYLSSLPEHADRSAISTLMAKLTRGSSGSPTPVAVQATETDETLGTIRTSVERGVQVEFDYQNSRGERERRRVDPLRVESVDADWYLRGWCHLREAVRTFRLDRIGSLAITDVPITHDPGDVTLPETLFEGTPDDLLVSLDVAPAALPLLADYMPADAPKQPSGDRIRTTVRVSHVHGLKRLIASMPGVAVVVAPEEARTAVAEWGRAGAERYGG
jgi:proteasome accessory factor C